MKESEIEACLVRMVRERGGLCYKWVSPGNPGVPDRIVITPAGRTIFVELKTQVGRLSAIQKWQRAQLEERGADIRVLRGMNQVKTFVRELTPEIVHEFIEKIVVSKPDKVDSKRHQRVDIHYNTIGLWCAPPPEEMEKLFQEHLATQRRKTA